MQIREIKFNYDWLVVSIPLKNDGVRQLGSVSSQYMES
jgi:hypothetical protein